MSGSTQFYLTALVSFLIAYLTTPLLRVVAVKLKIVDLPDARKIHRKITPLLGGAAVYMGFMAGLALNQKGACLYLPLIVGSTMIFLLGLADDIWKLSAQFRLVVQIIAAYVVVIFGERIEFLPYGIYWDALEIILTLFWIVGVTNACNYLDGMDGLATGSAVINLLFFAVILFRTGQSQIALLSVALLASCLGFLPYNFRHAKIFLGDAGSTLLGFIIASIATTGSWAEDSIVKISIPILILGVPIFDMVFTTIMRIAEGKVKTFVEWLKYGGRDHFHHYLVELGLTKTGAVLFIYVVTFALGLSALMVSMNSSVEAFFSLSQAAIIFIIIGVLIVIGSRRRSGWTDEH